MMMGAYPSKGAMANRRLMVLLLAAGGILTFLILAARAQPGSSPLPRPDHLYENSRGGSRNRKPGNNNIGTAAGGAGAGAGAGTSHNDLDLDVSDVAATADESGHWSSTPIHPVTVDKSTLEGGAIMPKLGNETLKAELGRAAWKLFHTTMARFPDKPTADEQTALFSYVHLFARLYPCGECAGHFRAILARYPPQVASRSRAAVWACFVHNEVNHSLGKPEFDCANIGDFYDCGCAEDEDEKGGKATGGGSAGAGEERGGTEEIRKLAAAGKESLAAPQSQQQQQQQGKPGKRPAGFTGTELKLEREGKTLGG